MGFRNLAVAAPRAIRGSAQALLTQNASIGSLERAGASIATTRDREAPPGAPLPQRGSDSERSERGEAVAIALSDRAPLDTLAQLDQLSRSASGAIADQLLRKRARAKYLSLPLGAALADLRKRRRTAALRAGDLEAAAIAGQLEQSYRNTIYCAGMLRQEGEKLEGRYCSNRWCLVCARVKTGKAINRYEPTLTSWESRWLVTLTAPNVAGAQLAGELRRCLADAIAIQRSLKRSGETPLVAVRKLECTYSARRDDYHPHFHFVVRDEAAARLLLQRWLERRPDARAIAQDVRPATNGDVRELFKYFTKLVTRAACNPAARGSVRVEQAEKLDVIFSAMRGLRVFQPVGFRLPKQLDDEEGLVGEAGHTRAPDRTRDRMGDFPSVAFWNWDQQLTDWFNVDTGEALAEYSPSAAMQSLVAGIELQRENAGDNAGENTMKNDSRTLMQRRLQAFSRGEMQKKRRPQPIAADKLSPDRSRNALQPENAAEVAELHVIATSQRGAAPSLQRKCPGHPADSPLTSTQTIQGTRRETRQ